MAEIEQTPDIITGDDIGANAIDHTALADSFINVSSSDPTKDNDTGSGYVVGSLWVNSTSGDVFQATNVSAEDAQWANQEGDDINPPFVYEANSKIGRSGGFEDGPGTHPTYQHSHIQMMTLAAEGNSTDIGEVGPATLGYKGFQAGCAKDAHPASYVYWYGGIGEHPSNPPTSNIVRHVLSSPATLADVGETSTDHVYGGTSPNGSHFWIWGGGGGTTSAGPPISTQIEKVAFGSPSTSADSGGDLSIETAHFGAHTDTANARAYQTGGYTMPGDTEVDTLAYFPIGISSGTNTDYGEASYNTHKMGSSNSTTHAYHFGSHSPFTDLIEKYPMTAPTSNTDVGNLVQGMYAPSGASAPTVTYTMGGSTYPPSQGIDAMSKFSTVSDANASDVGEMTEMAYGEGGAWTD